MNKDLRIISLIPSATEIICFLGLQRRLVGRSHDSNYPREALKVPVISSTGFDPLELTSRQIDDKVKESLHTGRSLFHLDQRLLKQLKPDLILTQELCEVCAPSFDEVKQAARISTGQADIISLEPRSLNEMLENILLVGEYTGQKDRAEKEIEKLKDRLEEVRRKTSKLKNRPTVVVLEWMEPLMSAGHWVPEMVELAGGRMLLAERRKKSKQISWEEVVETDPDVLIVAPCGFDTKRTEQEISLLTQRPGWDKLQAVKNRRVHLVDGDAYLTRSGPRLIDGVEILAQLFSD